MADRQDLAALRVHVEALLAAARWHIMVDGGAAAANVAFSLTSVESMATGALQAIEAMGLGGAAWAEVVLEAGGEEFVEGLKDGFCEHAATVSEADAGADFSAQLGSGGARARGGAPHDVGGTRGADGAVVGLQHRCESCGDKMDAAEATHKAVSDAMGQIHQARPPSLAQPP